MSAELARFLEEQDSKVFISGFVGDLFEANGCTEAGGSCKTLACFQGECRRTYRHLRCKHRRRRSHGPAPGGQMSHQCLQGLGME